MNLTPSPKVLEELGGRTEVPKKGFIYIGDRRLLRGAESLKEVLPLAVSMYDGKGSFVRVYVDPSQVGRQEGYVLKIDGSVTIVGNDLSGAFYGMMTLKQIVRQNPDSLLNLRIFDWPDFRYRGFMLDISRDRVPKIETIFRLIDLLSEMKYNELQLYTEHTFAYRDHETVWKDYSPLTSEDVLRIDEYARDRMIELVPNQNSFGHMAKWLVHEEYKHLAEVEDGFKTPWGEWWNIPFSLSPAVEEVYVFLESLYDELLPNFSSGRFNVGCDETFDLCQGKSKRLCDEIGEGRVYLNHILRIHEMLRKRGKTMLFWGDIIKNHPELVRELPDGMVALIWGYEKDHPFEKECEMFKEAGVPFYVCPGTSSWNAIIGRLENMVGNVENAARNGLKSDAIGLLMTDWGDNGHWQHLVFSFPGIVYAAAKSWNVSGEVDLEGALSAHVLLDRTGKSAKGLLRLENAYKKTGVELFNSNIFGTALIWPEKVKERIEEIDEERIEEAKEEILKGLEEFEAGKMEAVDADILKEEVKNGAEMALFSLDFVLHLKGRKVENLRDRFERLVEDFKRVWLMRSREGGLEKSVEKLRKVERYL